MTRGLTSCYRHILQVAGAGRGMRFGGSCGVGLQAAMGEGGTEHAVYCTAPLVSSQLSSNHLPLLTTLQLPILSATKHNQSHGVVKHAT